MQKTRIEWCDSTWNPVTGCLHGCAYCYARRISQRFGGPDGFKPRLHEGRLAEPQKAKKPQSVFVCSMADLFGPWVPDKWIQAVFDACKAAPQHRYLFLTKNPGRYRGLRKAYKYDDRPELLFGATATTSRQLSEAYDSQAEWLSIEPVLEEIDTDCFGEFSERPRWEWVVIGAESGNRSGKVIPKLEWIEAIVEECRAWGTPVFMKDSLAALWGEPLIQQYPWEA
jgi:protein gp37